MRCAAHSASISLAGIPQTFSVYVLKKIRYRRFPNPRTHFEQAAITLTETTSIWLTVDYNDGCSYFNRGVKVVFEDPANIDLGADICMPVSGNVNLSIDDAITPEIVWSTGETDIGTITVTNSGEYTVMAREDEDHCWAKDNIIVDFYELDLGDDKLLCPGNNVNLDAGGGFDVYTWLPTGTGQINTVSVNDEFTLIAEHEYGCLAYDTIKVRFKEDKQANNWYFGINAGITFNTANGEPIATTNSAMNASEGASAISDTEGNLLFYTDGVKVYNKNHAEMTNGSDLGGHFSSTQSSLIVQQPGSETIYYIFTTDKYSAFNGLMYSVIDISLQEGLGAVTIKNQQLIGRVSEKVTTALNTNGTDLWIIAHEFENDKFYTYSLTSAGLNSTPVISSIGAVISPQAKTMGQMRTSPRGDKLACAIYSSSGDFSASYEVFDFNQTTGELSNLMVLQTFF